MGDHITIAGKNVATDLVTIGGDQVHAELIKLGFGDDGIYNEVHSGSPLPVADSALAAALVSLLTELGQKLEPSDVAGLASQTTLAAVLAKLSADPASQTTLAAVLTKLGDGSQLTKVPPLASNTTVAVASSATVVTLQASNAARRALKVYNDSTAILYLKDGSAASTSDYSVQVGPGGYYEWPLPIFTGVVTGLWASANGFARITEGA